MLPSNGSEDTAEFIFAWVRERNLLERFLMFTAHENKAIHRKRDSLAEHMDVILSRRLDHQPGTLHALPLYLV